MIILKILTIITLLLGFIVTIKNFYYILQRNIDYSMYYLILALFHSTIPLIYVILN